MPTDRAAEGRAADVIPERMAIGSVWLLGLAALSCAASVAMMAAGLDGPIPLVSLVLMFSLAPGAALLPYLGAREDGLTLGPVLGVSLALSTLGAQAMLESAWAPIAATYVLAGVCLPPIVVTLRRRGFVPRSIAEALGLPAGSDDGRVDGPLAHVLRRPRTHALILLTVVAGWLGGVYTTDLSGISGWGLLAALGPTWYLALGLLLVGFALAVWSTPTTPAILISYLVALVLMLHATTALLYDVPRYAWTYKHLAVVEAIMSSGEVDRTLDVYNNWPGFFALSGWLSESSGVAPLHYAEWAQAFFSIAAVAMLLFAVRGLGVSQRVRWTAVWLYLFADWFGQNYFAPQALGFVLSLLVLGLCIRCAAPKGATDRRLDRWLRSRRAGIPLRLAEFRERAGILHAPAPFSPVVAVALGLIAYLAVVVTHQLSPVLLVAQVAAFALITGRLHLWMAGVMVAIEAWWISRAWDFVGDRFNILSVDPTTSAGSVGGARNVGLPGVPLVYWAPRILLLSVAVLAVLGLLRLLAQTVALRPEARRIFNPAPAVLAISPLLTVGFQSYGGEGFLRGALFALPWVAVLAAQRTAPRAGPRRTTARESGRLVLISLLLTPLLLLAYFGNEQRDTFRPADVAAFTWIEENAPSDSVKMLFAPNSPAPLTANYATKRIFAGGELVLSDLPRFRLGSLGSESLPPIRSLLLSQEGTERYVVISPSQIAYADLYKLFAPGSTQRLITALESSPFFETVFDRDGAYVFRLRPPTAGT